MNKDNNRMKVFRRTLSFRILIKFITSLIVYVISVLLLFLLGVRFCSLFTWYGNEPLYPLLHFISSNNTFVLAALFIMGFLFIFIYYWMKTFSYLEDIIIATENVYDSKDELISLPMELKEVENKMNHIKLNVRESQRTAKEAEQRKNDLVVYLAHDLKTPLTSVIGYLTLLRDENKISEELREKYLSISLEKAERLEDLINEFFEITRFSLTNLTLELSRVNLTRMLEQISYEFKPMLSEKNLNCVLNVPPDLEIKCDIDKIQRVFDNLLRNAVNYSFENSTIEISVVKQSDHINLKFTNHGNTIPQEKLNRIFEQFYRLDTARTTKGGGSGLGLAIAKEIVTLHHGTITAFSEKEIISFEVVLPLL